MYVGMYIAFSHQNGCITYSGSFYKYVYTYAYAPQLDSMYVVYVCVLVCHKPVTEAPSHFVVFVSV